MQFWCSFSLYPVNVVRLNGSWLFTKKCHFAVTIRAEVNQCIVKQKNRALFQIEENMERFKINVDVASII
jgi:hypothetical protein